MIERLQKANLLRYLQRYPAVILVGARQCGKTTLARSLGGAYYDLETEAGRLKFDVEWPARTDSDQLLILDEAQSYPEIFPRIRSAIDSRRKSHGRFLLLGSVTPALMHHVAESLAGRAAIVELSPLMLGEIPYRDLDRLWLCGGFPDGGVLEFEQFPGWQRNYTNLLIQRDLPNLGLPAKPLTTERLLKMLAALQAQPWNASKLGASLGLNYQTVTSYLEYLHGAFLTRALLPFESNLKKRLVKSPKIYIRDTGILHALLDLGTHSDLLAQPWVGFSWEGFVIEQIISTVNLSGEPTAPYYLRTSTGDEIDLIVHHRDALWAFEIKLTGEPRTEDAKRLTSLGAAIGATHRILVHRGTLDVRSSEISILNLDATLALLR